ncbi:hypothetical protein BGZ61DRAFT_461584 [Ilyonectria robusta]|uniref:uncharacterized protein n=1 Tax=Ilyonectria robusta TaxID=1079257 RepID=UPI001E8EA572|nr:uncharacterized protein BGZ61DRAFT_461584 [Ilyonectria robusta]KAH8666069.1 hypothetical protein BGZ61DRAFT_461584 [Ilyonectria robusta]
MLGHIHDTGLSVIYEPVTGPAVVDIVIIHGLKGHPFKTWTARNEPRHPSLATPTLPQSECSDTGKEREKKLWHGPLAWKPSGKRAPEDDAQMQVAKRVKRSDSTGPPVFWPFDLLPQECPKARILTYGYDTKITKYMAGGTNKSSIFSHSKDFMFALSRDRVSDRPLLFVAHSLGGIVVKEMLARSSISTESNFKNIVESTAAIIFLGTPHRGSPDLSALGEWARSFLSILRMETTSAILDTLGLKTTDLERAQESFSGLWQQYDFRVKTFQEGLSLMGVNLGVLGNKVVPDSSSLIGDQREHAETLQANHLDMCRYTGADDPNYLKVAGEIRAIYLSIIDLNTRNIHQNGSLLPGGSPSSPPGDGLNDMEKSCLGSLWFPRMNSRYQSLESPMENTCRWLFKRQIYRRWSTNSKPDERNRILWIKGKPGAGKSVLIKEAFRRTLLAEERSGYCTAAYFFSAQGEELEQTVVGLLRSLLHQLLPHHRHHLPEICRMWKQKWGSTKLANMDVPWEEAELKSFFRMIYSHRPVKSTVIFIDALDECDSSTLRSQIFFWKDLTKSAFVAGVDLRVCFSSRHFPAFFLDCPTVTVEEHNRFDLERYVRERFKYSIAASNRDWGMTLRLRILSKSAGVFLWVILVVDATIMRWEEGKGRLVLLRQLDEVPQSLGEMFTMMLKDLKPEAKLLTLRLLQWATLAAKPFRLHEWHHILAFIKQPFPSSLDEWRKSDEYTDSDDQLERQIKSLSRGLLQVSAASVLEKPQDKVIETISVNAGAGSLDLENGETRVIEVIHESVRQFFLQGGGFSILDPDIGPSAVGIGHLSIINTCLDYINIVELDALVQARILDQNQNGTLAPIFTSSGNRSGPSSRELGSPVRHGEAQARNFGGFPWPPDAELQNYGTIIPLHTAEHRDGTDAIFTFESLREMFPLSVTIDIEHWTTTTQNMYDQGLQELRSRNSSARQSVTGQSQMLQSYPALLSYATFQLFNHFRLARAQGVDIKSALARLGRSDTWARWVALKEDIPQGLGLAEYATKYEDLPLPHNFEIFAPLYLTPLQRVDMNGAHTTGDWQYSFPTGESHGMILDPPESPRVEDVWRKNLSGTYQTPQAAAAHRRSGSVASFSSAGSHSRLPRSPIIPRGDD